VPSSIHNPPNYSDRTNCDDKDAGLNTSTKFCLLLEKQWWQFRLSHPTPIPKQSTQTTTNRHLKFSLFWTGFNSVHPPGCCLFYFASTSTRLRRHQEPTATLLCQIKCSIMNMTAHEIRLSTGPEGRPSLTARPMSCTYKYNAAGMPSESRGDKKGFKQNARWPAGTKTPALIKLLR